MKPRFLADADLNKAIVTGLLRREPSIDFLSAQTAGLHGMSDADVLILAADTQRVLISHDVSTMPFHFQAFTSVEGRSWGVFLVPQSLDVAAAIEELLLIWRASEAAEWQNQLAWLPL